MSRAPAVRLGGRTRRELLRTNTSLTTFLERQFTMSETIDVAQDGTTAGTNADTRLRSIVQRIVRLQEERKSLGADVKEIYQEAKSAGYELKALRLVVRRQMEDEEARMKRQEIEAGADMLEAALGDFAALPLGEAAVSRKRH